MWHSLILLWFSLDFGFCFQLSQADEMTVSITGATGFIGKRLVQKLHAGIHSHSMLSRTVQDYMQTGKTAC